MGGGGPKTDQRLRAMGVVTIGDLAALPPGSLIARFGRSHGSWLYQAAREVDATPLVRFRPPPTSNDGRTYGSSKSTITTAIVWRKNWSKRSRR